MTGGAGTWPEHYRVWRADRLQRMSRALAPDLRRLARFVHQLSEELAEVAREAALADGEARGTTLPRRPLRTPRPQGWLPSPE